MESDAEVTKEEASSAFEEAIAWHSVGVVVNRFQEVGTGVAIQWKGHDLILTAAHVIRDTKVENLRFFFRVIGQLTRGDIKTAPSFIAAPYRKIHIVRVERSRDQDLAFLEVGAELEKDGPVFYQMDPKIPARLDRNIVLYGLQAELNREVAPSAFAVGAAVEWTEEVPPGFENGEGVELVVRYTSVERHPRGFSGCGAWSHALRPKDALWHTAPYLRGIVTLYRKTPPSLVVIPRGEVERFLSENLP